MDEHSCYSSYIALILQFASAVPNFHSIIAYYVPNCEMTLAILHITATTVSLVNGKVQPVRTLFSYY